MNYLSPYVIIDAASIGIINGSLIVFIGLFLSSLVFGRAWCGWFCPGDGLNIISGMVKPEPAKGGKRDRIKYITWVLWIGVIFYTAYSAGGYKRIDFFYMTESGISVTEPSNYIMYFMVVGIIVGMNLFFGKAAACRYICWMAPFMVIGTKIKKTLRYPSLHLEADEKECISCNQCTRNCPRGLDVHLMVKSEEMQHSECINCASCIDICPKNAIQFRYVLHTKGD
jgi:polyferredoxin